MSPEETFQAAFDQIRSEFPDWSVHRESMEKDDFRRGPYFRSLRAVHALPDTDKDKFVRMMSALGIAAHPIHLITAGDSTQVYANLELMPDRPLDIDLPMMEGKWQVDPGQWGKAS